VIDSSVGQQIWQKLTQTEPKNLDMQERRLSMLVGGGMVLFGLLRRPSLAGLFRVTGGGYLLYRGLTGHCLIYEIIGLNPRQQSNEYQIRAADEAHPEHTIDLNSQVDEALWETFPASDPPSTY
jgi:uncharacterized membrane protein